MNEEKYSGLKRVNIIFEKEIFEKRFYVWSGLAKIGMK